MILDWKNALTTSISNAYYNYREAKYYLLLAEKEQDKTSNRLYYCEKCGMNLKNQGFVIHPLS